MPKKGQKKAEVRVFLDGPKLKLVDDLMPVYGNTRSEVIRSIIQDWMGANIAKRAELLKLGKESKKEGYIS